MEAVEKTLTYRGDDTGHYSKLLPDDKDNKWHRETKCDQSNYVDLDDLLDMKSDSTKTVKVTFTGESNQLAVIKSDGDTSFEKSNANRKALGDQDRVISEDFGEQSKDKWADGPPYGELPLETLILTGVPNTNVDFENGNIKQLQTELDPSDNVCSESDELQYTDMYLNSKTESDDSVSVVLSDVGGSDTIEDESHYITTHEIQLTELDHDVDYDLGRGTWDFEDDNLVYSFVDYASFESDETQEGTLILESGQAKVKSSKTLPNVTHQRARGGADICTELESDLCDSEKSASSDESMCKSPNDSVNNAGKIHLSIKTSSMAVNEPYNAGNRDGISYHTKHVGDRSHFFFTSTDARAEDLCDRTQYFIPAPGRQHLATKLRGKDINDYSSGASSSISELDDADKEVRNLTAKSFRSLACPYFDAINLSTSSESSVSEYGLGLNKWSAYMDLKCGSVSQGKENNAISHKSSSATIAMSKNSESKNRRGTSISNKKAMYTKTSAVDSKMSTSQESLSPKETERKGPFKPKQGEIITLTETLNFSCNSEVAPAEGARRPKCSKNAPGSRSKDEVSSSGVVDAKLVCEAQYQHSDAGDSMGNTQKKAIFASSLLKNVISKKMQFEQERKMERGEIRDLHPAPEVIKERSVTRGLQRQISEASSGFTANSVDEQMVTGSRSNSCEPTEERRGKDVLNSANSNEKGLEENDGEQPPKAQLSRSQNSAFKSWKEGDEEHQEEAEVTAPVAPPAKENAGELQKKEEEKSKELDGSRLTKLSQLFVPSSQLVSKEKPSTDDPPSCTPAVSGHAGTEIGDKELPVANNTQVVEKEDTEKVARKPEIKIRLRSVKENKGYSLNIANLLTPKISINTINTLKAAGESKFQLLSAADKIPHFTVRDIRENKCKFQTPIYHVRDVRKLVKSSYRFVSLDSGDNKSSTGPSVTTDAQEGKVNKGLHTHLLPSPIVIKCHSVKTNSNGKQQQPAPTAEVSSQKKTETERSSPKISCETSKCEAAPSHWTSGRVAPILAKRFSPNHVELQLNIEEKSLKQRQEKLTGDSAERKSDTKIPKQAALEKLKAAVKTMEQLYVFDRNEWKRKTQAPRPVTDSHVLSLIAREEQGAEEPGTAVVSSRLNETDINRSSQMLITAPMSEISKAQQDKGSMKIIHVPYTDEPFKMHSQQSQVFSNKSVLHVGNGTNPPVKSSSLSNDTPQRASVSQMPSTMKSIGSKTPVAPLSLKITPPKCGQVDQRKVKGSPTSTTAAAGHPDSENYLAIPGGGYASEIKLPNRDQTVPNIVSSEGNSNVSQTNTGDTKRPKHSDQPLKRSAFTAESQSPEQHPTATIYHHPVPVAVQGPQPPVFCLTPPVPTLSSTTSGRGREAFPQTQRKMLLDPTTGHYYLVDTPMQATTKRLFDPETGQYVDVPMSHSPVPVSVSPLALSPGAYTPTYMIYPGFIPSPTLPTQPLASQASCQFEPINDGREHGKHIRHGQEAITTSQENLYYTATTDATPALPRRPVSLGHITTGGSLATSERKPVISITAPQGPRIIAPPSFDGTTMSFVVEHR